MWKALRGDPTDNIKGITGVGDKTAHKLIKDKQKLHELLQVEENRMIFEKNVNLIRLVDFSDDMTAVEMSIGTKDFVQLKKVFEDLEFSSIVKEKSWEKYVNTFARL